MSGCWIIWPQPDSLFNFFELCSSLLCPTFVQAPMSLPNSGPVRIGYWAYLLIAFLVAKVLGPVMYFYLSTLWQLRCFDEAKNRSLALIFRSGTRLRPLPPRRWRAPSPSRTRSSSSTGGTPTSRATSPRCRFEPLILVPIVSETLLRNTYLNKLGRHKKL